MFVCLLLSHVFFSNSIKTFSDLGGGSDKGEKDREFYEGGSSR